MIKKGFLAIVLLATLFFAGLSFISAINEGSQYISDISSGITRGFYVGDVLGFSALGDERHTFLLAGIRGENVTVRVAEPVQSATLLAGGETKFDFNGDNVMDLYVKINSILVPGKSANVTIKTISEKASAETAPVVPIVEQEPVANVNNNLTGQQETSEKSSNAGLWIIVGLAVIAAAALITYFALRKRNY